MINSHDAICTVKRSLEKMTAKERKKYLEKLGFEIKGGNDEFKSNTESDEDEEIPKALMMC